jgi:opacity protein-like surface antigen
MTLIALCLVSLLPTYARAQIDKHVAVGAQIGIREFMDDHFSRSNPSISLLYRLSRHPDERKQGWVWRLGGTAGYSHAHFETDLGGTDTKIGTTRMIPVLGGVERAYRHDRVKVALSLEAGPSFNKFSIDNPARAAYEGQNGVPLEDIEVKNSVAVRAGLGVWYDVNRWVGIHTGLNYLYDRPKATTTAGGISSSETWNIDRVTLATGFVVGIF